MATVETSGVAKFLTDDVHVEILIVNNTTYYRGIF